MKITDELKEQEIKLIDLAVEQSNPSAFVYILLWVVAVITSALIIACYAPLWSIGTLVLAPLSFLLVLVGLAIRYIYYSNLIHGTAQEIERLKSEMIKVSVT